jgi:hypothetical protein
VSLGRYNTREEAERLREEVRTATGQTPQVISTPAGYRVQYGAFRQKENADRAVAELEKQQFRPEVSVEP